MQVQKKGSFQNLVIFVMLVCIVILGVVSADRERKLEAAAQPIEVIPPSKWLCDPPMAANKTCVRAIQTRNMNDGHMVLMVQQVVVAGKTGKMLFHDDRETESLDDVDFGDSVTVITQ